MEVGGPSGEPSEDQDHAFRVGDFVWEKKTASGLWWPGQIYDPRDASDIASNSREEGKLLVAIFDDRSSSWCLPSQLILFVDNFEEKLMDGSMNLNGVDKESFLNAVQNAVNEMGRIMELRFTCRCRLYETKVHLDRPVVSNAGIKDGLLVTTDPDASRFPITQYAPSEIVAKVRGYAKTASFDSVLDLAMLKSWLSAYSYKTFGCGPSVYRDPTPIGEMEDEDHDGTTADAPVSSPNVISPANRIRASIGEPSRKRRRESSGKSVAGSPSSAGLRRSKRIKEASKSAGKSATVSDDNIRAKIAKPPTVSISDVSIDVHELLSNMQSVAPRSFNYIEEGLLIPARAFVSAFRSSMFGQGPDGKKLSDRRSLASQLSSTSNEISPNFFQQLTGCLALLAGLVCKASSKGEKLHRVINTMETQGSSFRKEDKVALRRLLEDVEVVVAKVQSMANNPLIKRD